MTQPLDPAKVRKTPAEWAEQEGFEILQPNGWLEIGAPSFDTPITYGEFHARALNSVIGPPADAGTVTLNV